ncbi:phytanoyl-CoA dioxygenase family protein [Marinoscillum furvescens]|uniref:Phytanoyl-CoA dioxygenase PhyH n=1 Tax=Marinoscillum furvescens DSM 4134 TaxID=1122208 RepID=A0A3D9KY74_MARFU|nr:phytanoyl-CoA dioxygenase family protein [Marinoscillum furvescens]RED92309.1 phytanoyl-CoA dioxygenase PhyH [Marinoscillum furvescens DSM 4134]
MHFNDKATQRQFDQDGYCKLQLLSPDAITDLTAFAKDFIMAEEVKNTDYGMYVSLEEEASRKQKITDYVRSVVAPALSEHVSNYKIHLGGYLIKAADDQKYTFPHQDWIFVAHGTSAVSATVWISLLDIGPENGTLGFLKGSHKFLDFPIGSPSPAVPTPAMGKEPIIFEHLTFETVKAGEALIFNNKTIHAALPNSGSFPRLAVGIGITPADAPLHHYFLNPENEKELLQLRVNESFYMTYNNDDLYQLYQVSKLPNGVEVTGRVPVNRESYPSEEKLLASIATHGNVKNNYSLNLGKHFGQPIEQATDDSVTETAPEESEWIDNRTFFETYTPINIYREAKMRIGKWLR